MLINQYQRLSMIQIDRSIWLILIVTKFDTSLSLIKVDRYYYQRLSLIEVDRSLLVIKTKISLSLIKTDRSVLVSDSDRNKGKFNLK